MMQPLIRNGSSNYYASYRKNWFGLTVGEVHVVRGFDWDSVKVWAFTTEGFMKKADRAGFKLNKGLFL